MLILENNNSKGYFYLGNYGSSIATAGYFYLDLFLLLLNKLHHLTDLLTTYLTFRTRVIVYHCFLCKNYGNLSAGTNSGSAEGQSMILLQGAYDAKYCGCAGKDITSIFLYFDFHAKSATRVA